MKWAQTAYLSERQFFAETGSVPFYFFMRAGKDNTSYGGAALSNSFLLFLPESLDDTDGPDRLGLVIAHEMVHHFVGTLDSPEGIEGSWYSEGLAEYYSRLVTFRTGLILPRVFTDAVNQSAVLYFTNPLRNLPNEKIAEGFWRDKNAQGVPYQRGFFYFVDVNHKLLMASKGKVSVDTIVLSLLNRRSRGDRLTPQNWLDEIEKVLGPAGRQEFESVIVHGDTVLAASDAFGPCFDRRSVMMPMFELGFDQHATWDSSPPVVHGVVSGSAAQRAGLRDGDKILSMSPSEVERLRSSLSMRIQLKIERGRDTLEIEYLPRSSQSVEGYQWVHNLGVPDEKCAM
jgi:predicted metalloprotease with PDZ domain